MFCTSCILRVQIRSPRWPPVRPPLPLRRLYLRAGDFRTAGRRGWRQPSRGTAVDGNSNRASNAKNSNALKSAMAPAREVEVRKDARERAERVGGNPSNGPGNRRNQRNSRIEERNRN